MDDSRSRKTIRQFNCRDALWQVFEEMARELECSVDYLINESMRQYAKARKYAVPGAEKADGAAAPAGASAPPAPPRPRMGTPGAMPAAPGRPSPVPPSPPPLAGSQPGGVSRPSSPGFSAPPPPRPSLFPVEGRGAPRPQAPPGASAPPSPPQPAADAAQGVAPETDAFAQVRRPPSPVAPAAPQAPAAQSDVSFEVARAPSTGQGRAPLHLVFNGQRIPVRKEQFVIGRGLKVCDLAIKDSNISRRHAAVLFHNGAYYIKDLNSTNGIEYNGMRIDSKRIEEGDGFKICDYELKFTFQ